MAAIDDSVAIREHLTTIINEMDKRNEQRFSAQERALQLALSSIEKSIDAQAIAMLAQLGALKDATEAKLIAQDRAVTKAETAAEKRFEAVNEFRSSLSDQATRLMPRAEAEQRLMALSEKVGELNNRVNTSQGRSSGVAAGWGWLIGAVALVAGIMAIAARFIK